MKNKKSYYAVIPADVRYNKKICSNAKLLYGEITALCNEKGFCWASNQYFADLYGVHKRTISKWFSQLQKENYIKIEIEKNINGYDRKVYIHENVHTPTRKGVYPLHEKVHTPTRKELHNNTYNNTTNNTYNIDLFNELWTLYDKKTNKVQAVRSFKSKEKLFPENIKDIILDYVRSTPDKQYRKHFATWLNNECWNDEIIIPKTPEEIEKEKKDAYKAEQKRLIQERWKKQERGEL